MGILQQPIDIPRPLSSTSTYLWSSILHYFGDGESDDVTNASIIGIVVAISGNVVISLALNCQKLAHRRLEREREEKRKQRGEGKSVAAARRTQLGQRRLSLNSHASILEERDGEMNDREELDDEDEERTRVGEASQRHSPESDGESDYGESISYTELNRSSASPSPWSFRERAHSLLMETEPLLVVTPQGISPHGSLRVAYGSRGRTQSHESTIHGKRRGDGKLLERMFRASKGKDKAIANLDLEDAATISVQVQAADDANSNSPKPPPNMLKFVDPKPSNNDSDEFESDYLKSKLW